MDLDLNEQSISQDNKKIYREKQKSLIKNWKDKHDFLFFIQYNSGRKILT